MIVPGIEFSDGEIALEKLKVLQMISIDRQTTQARKDLQRRETSNTPIEQDESISMDKFVSFLYRLFRWRIVTSFLLSTFFLEIWSAMFNV